jgi:flavin reductase (DIM6/NTAB) family NADH-FMN oxidoreductase RutF
MNVDRNTLRDSLRFWSSGVSIVSTVTPPDVETHPYAGMTVSSFMSLSLEPPQILVSLAKQSFTTEAVLQAGFFAVSVLAAEQGELADRFAGRSGLASNVDRFNGVPYQTSFTGAPILQDSLAWFDCQVAAIHDGSTHWIVIGDVLATAHRDDAAPLIYYNRAYSTLTPEHEQP